MSSLHHRWWEYDRRSDYSFCKQWKLFLKTPQCMSSYIPHGQTCLRLIMWISKLLLCALQIVKTHAHTHAHPTSEHNVIATHTHTHTLCTGYRPKPLLSHLPMRSTGRRESRRRSRRPELTESSTRFASLDALLFIHTCSIHNTHVYQKILRRILLAHM